MSPAHDTLRRHLARARRALFRRAAERTAFPLVALGAVLVALALVLALGLTLYRGHYALLRAGLLAGGAALLVAGIWRMVREHLDADDVAVAAGSLEPERKDEILSALEFAREAEREERAAGRAAGGAAPSVSPVAHPSSSAALRASAIARATETASRLPVDRLADWPARRRWVAIAAGSFAIAAAAALSGGSRTPTVLAHIADPAGAPRAPIALRVVPGSAEIEGGQSVVVRAYVRGTGSRPKLLVLERPAGPEAAAGAWRERALEDPDDETREGAHSGERAYSARLPNVKEDLRYVVRVADASSKEFALTVRDLPRATGYRIRYDYPAYTGLPDEEVQALTGDLVAPRGTKARLEVTLNRDVASAALIGDRSRLRLDGVPGERRVAFDVPIRSDDAILVRLQDVRGRRSDLGPFELRAIPDRPPTVTILAPDVVEDVARDMVAVLIAGVTDDHGVRKVLLRYRVRDEAERTEVLHEERAGARELAVRYTWPLQSLNLLPGEEIAYQIGAVDGNAVDGPQTSWSDERRLRFPSATEILASMEKERDASIEALEEAVRGARELQQRTEEMRRDLGRSRELTWEQRQQIQKTLEGQQQLRETIDQVTDQLQQGAEKLSQSRALNAELVEKIHELQQLLSQIKDQSLLRAMQRLQQAMKNMTPQEMERALQSFKLNQEDVLRSLQRTIELLKQIRIEERMEAASERAAEMERRQIALNDSLSRANRPEEAKSLAEREAEIAKMAAQQKEAMEALAKDLQSMDPPSAEEAEALGRELGAEGMQPELEEAEKQLASGERDEARPPTQSLQKRLERLRRRTDRMRESFQERKKNQLAKEMEDAAQDLLDIASLQERMLRDEESSVGERAEQQKGLEEATEQATEKLAAIAKQTLFMTPDVTQAVGRALQSQESAVGRYSQQDLMGGLMGTKEATIALNQAATALLKAQESMQGSKSSTGMSEAMQQLQSLAGDQQSLNDQSMGMLPGQAPNGRLTPGDGAALGRMAAEQEAIRRGLEDALQKMGQGGGKPLGNMGDLGDEMKRVEQDLRSGRLDQETVNRQQRILSRLLDAPRAVEKRDYSRKRTSRPGVDVVRSSPGALSPELLKARPSLASLLAKGSRDPVTPRFRALVDEYLESLMKEGGR